MTSERLGRTLDLASRGWWRLVGRRVDLDGGHRWLDAPTCGPGPVGATWLRAEAERLGVWLREACRAMPDPAPLSMFENVYADPHPIIDAERATYAAYLDSFADTLPPEEPDPGRPKPVQPAVAQAFARGGEAQ